MSKQQGPIIYIYHRKQYSVSYNKHNEKEHEKEYIHVLI